MERPRQSGHVSPHHLFVELVFIPHLWRVCRLCEQGLGLWTPRSWSKARLEDRWRECFQTILLSLISAYREPPEELQVTSALRGSGISQYRQGLETFSLCTDQSGNLESIHFLSTYHASGCVCGGFGGGVEDSLRCLFSLFFWFWYYSVHRKVPIPRSFCLRLFWKTAGYLCMTFSDHTLKVSAFPSYLCILWGRNYKNADCGPRPFFIRPRLCETRIFITVL